MKRIEAIIRKTKFEEVEEALLSSDIDWFEYHNVHGIGQSRQERIYRGVQYSTDVIERVALTIVCRDQFVEPTVKVILQVAHTGVLAGLVGITAGCDMVSPIGAVIIGLVCGVVLVYAIEFIDHKLHIDDLVGASSVHGVCGILGTLMTGLLSTSEGLFYGHGWGFFGAECFGVLVIDLWAAACGIVLFFGIKKVHGLRVEARVEEEGLDIYEHGEACYN